MIEGEIDIESANVLLMAEERNGATLEVQDNVLRIKFKAGEINECRAMVNAIMNDLSCAEKLMEV